MKTLKSNISEAYKAQVDCLRDSEYDFYDKKDTKEKVNDLARNGLNISKTFSSERKNCHQ